MPRSKIFVTLGIILSAWSIDKIHWLIDLLGIITLILIILNAYLAVKYTFLLAHFDLLWWYQLENQNVKMNFLNKTIEILILA